MVSCYLVINGRRSTKYSEIRLPAVPHKGDIISGGDHRAPHYVVHCVEFNIGFDSVNLHVQEFPNRAAAMGAVDGFRNQSGWFNS